MSAKGASRQIVAFNTRTKQKRVLASQIDGVPFNEPNDLTIDAEDGFYFSDPYFSHRDQPKLQSEDVYYVSSQGSVSRVSRVAKKPNGVLLTPDGTTLYLADTVGEVIYRYEVLGPGRLANERLWARVGARPDGLTLDEHGNLYVGSGAGGLRVFSPAGDALGTITAEYVSNCVFGGRDFSTLYATSREKFLAIATKIHGVRPPCAA